MTPASNSARICTGIPSGRVNVRSCGSLRCPAITTLPEGAQVEILQSGDWDRITTDFVEGWIYSQYVCK